MKWNEHIAGIWADVLRGRIQNGDRIVEVASGGTDKIGRALSSLSFRGTIYVVEPESKALFDTMASYRRILPQCNVVPVCSQLSAFQADYDVLLSNHPLDDMVAGNFLKPEEFNTFFNDHYDKPIDATKLIWTVHEMTDKMSKARLSIISQYPSYFFTANGFTKPDDVAHEALTTIRNEMNGLLIRNNRWIIA
jgi:hypothetical protein